MKTSCGKFLNLAHYFPYDVKLRLLAHSRSFLANQKARNAIVGAENLLNKGNLTELLWRLTCVLYFTVLNKVTLTESCYLRVCLQGIDSLSHFRSWQSSYFPNSSCRETRKEDTAEVRLAICK